MCRFYVCYNIICIMWALYMFLVAYTGNARAASICSQVLLLLAYIVCLLVSVRDLRKQHYDK